MKSIKDIIKETILIETNASIKIDDSNFFVRLINFHGKKKLFNLLLLFTTLIICFVFIISSFIFFINDVLLYKNKPKINSYGAIIPEKSCNRQSVLFLFNSADRWANTGIQLQKEDEIKISFSGGFYSDIAGLKNAAKDNYKPTYEWISFSKPDTTNKSKYSLVPEASFGSILYQIAGEIGCNDNDATELKFDKSNSFIPITKNGVLYLSVNDIYLSNPIIEKMIADTTARKLLSFGGNSNTFHTDQEIRTHFRDNPNAFFNDNLGEILVVIDINRKVNFINWRTSWYRHTENTINDFWDNSTGWFIPFICSVGFFIWAVIVLLFYKLLFITFSIIFLFCLPYIKMYFLKLKKIIQ